MTPPPPPPSPAISSPVTSLKGDGGRCNQSAVLSGLGYLISKVGEGGGLREGLFVLNVDVAVPDST